MGQSGWNAKTFFPFFSFSVAKGAISSVKQQPVARAKPAVSKLNARV
jgi:hypothetical protein